MTRAKFRRRNFFIKKHYQSRFALYPILFLTLFLVGAGGYLHWYLKGFLEFQLYLPHSHLENPWYEITPVLAHVAFWGGGAFLVALGAWVWRRFGILRRDLNQVADWMAAHVYGQGVESAPHFRDTEVEMLGTSLASAVGNFERWSARVASRKRLLLELAERLEAGSRKPGPADSSLLDEIRSALADLERVVDEVQIDESLS